MWVLTRRGREYSEGSGSARRVSSGCYAMNWNSRWPRLSVPMPPLMLTSGNTVARYTAVRSRRIERAWFLPRLRRV